jgi:peptidoglycan hydrolase-like protein with peptidoglycan-binding domain
MNRVFAIVAGVALSTLTAGSLLAQSSATTKPTSHSTMQHTSAAAGVKTTTSDSASVKTSHKAASRQTWTKDQIKEAQEGLAKAGYFKGKATGVLGRRTRTALRQYQKANKLPVTGQLSDSVLTRLRSS